MKVEDRRGLRFLVQELSQSASAPRRDGRVLASQEAPCLRQGPRVLGRLERRTRRHCRGGSEIRSSLFAASRSRYLWHGHGGSRWLRPLARHENRLLQWWDKDQG